MLQIEEFRKAIGMSQREFSNHFGIPIGTLRNWEQERAKPPEYVFQMIFKIMERDRNMIDIETVKFMKMLEKLAKLSRNGIDSFKNATPDNFPEKIFYDENTRDEKGEYKIVSEAFIGYEHHDAYSYYGSDNGNYTVKVEFIDDEPSVVIYLAMSRELIVVQNGEWYFT